jgi:tetratricopeptide (TPR) repeat protein
LVDVMFLEKNAWGSMSTNGLKTIRGTVNNWDFERLIKTSTLLAKKDYFTVIVDGSGKFAVAVGNTGLKSGMKANATAKEIIRNLGGKGGGKAELAQGVVTKLDSLEEDLGKTLALYLGIPYFSSRDENVESNLRSEPPSEKTERSDLLLKQGIDLWRKGYRDKAMESFDKSIELDPMNEQAWIKRGIAFGNQGEQNKAIECFRHSLEINQESAEAYHNLGVAFGHIGQYKDAEENFNKAIEKKPDHANAWLNMGTANLKLAKYIDALNCFNKAIELNPKDEIAWFSKGVALSEMKDDSEAIEYLRTAIELKPSFEAAKAKIASIESKLKN